VEKPPEARRFGGAPALCNFCNFSTKLTHYYAHFGQNSYFKATTQQLNAFEKQSKHTK